MGYRVNELPSEHSYQRPDSLVANCDPQPTHTYLQLGPRQHSKTRNPLVSLPVFPESDIEAADKVEPYRRELEWGGVDGRAKGVLGGEESREESRRREGEGEVGVQEVGAGRLVELRAIGRAARSVGPGELGREGTDHVH